jgi:hypothetical protein
VHLRQVSNYRAFRLSTEVNSVFVETHGAAPLDNSKQKLASPNVVETQAAGAFPLHVATHVANRHEVSSIDRDRRSRNQDRAAARVRATGRRTLDRNT